jgi:hypothetical protein
MLIVRVVCGILKVRDIWIIPESIYVISCFNEHRMPDLLLTAPIGGLQSLPHIDLHGTYVSKIQCS